MKLFLAAAAVALAVALAHESVMELNDNQDYNSLLDGLASPQKENALAVIKEKDAKIDARSGDLGEEGGRRAGAPPPPTDWMSSSTCSSNRAGNDEEDEDEYELGETNTPSLSFNPNLSFNLRRRRRIPSAAQFAAMSPTLKTAVNKGINDEETCMKAQETLKQSNAEIVADNKAIATAAKHRRRRRRRL